MICFSALLLAMAAATATAQPGGTTRPAANPRAAVDLADKPARLARLPLPRDAEAVYGLSFEVSGEPGAIVVPTRIRTYDRQGRERQSIGVNNGYGTFRAAATATPTHGRIEFFAKRGAATVELEVSRQGEGAARVTGLTLVPGGFPDDPPVPGPPYLDLIDGLRPNRDLAARPQKPASRPAPVPADLQPFLAVAPADLARMVPELKPFHGGFGPWPVIGHQWAGYEKLQWDPREPTVIRDADGKPFDARKQFPVTGTEKVVGVNGKTFELAYHQPPESQWDQVVRQQLKESVADWRKNDPPLARIYVDLIGADVVATRLMKAALAMADRYERTGDREAGLRAAAIFHGFARVAPNWPIYGNPYFRGPWQFGEPDGYERWFSFPIMMWQPPSYGSVARPVEAFAKLDDSIWTDVSQSLGVRDAWSDTADGLFLHLTRVSLKFDAYQRTDPWTYYHNTIGGQIGAYLRVGRAVGTPDLIHYAIHKAEQSVRYTTMPDGMFPESTSYHLDMIGGLQRALAVVHDYSDPPNFRPLRGTRIEHYRAGDRSPLFRRAQSLIDRLNFPDGGAVTIHDTWPTRDAGRLAKPRPAGTYLLPDFGHAVLGHGGGDDALEAHLNYSGVYNHGHVDMLNLTLWAYGDELVSDLGYTHLGPYLADTPIHNLVVVDRASQRRHQQSHGGDLLAWFPGHGRDDAARVVEADADEQAYSPPRVTRYRRGLVTVPFGPGRNAVLDVFDVAGGSLQEWTFNGVSDYRQQVHSDLPLKPLGRPSLSDRDEPPITDPLDPRLGFASPQEGRSGQFAAFRNVRVAPNDRPWTLTLSPGEVLPADHAWANRRATYDGQRPSLKVHFLGPQGGEVFVTDAPRHRNRSDKGQAQRTEWADHTMSKVFVARRTDDATAQPLTSRFTAVWEPFLTQPFLRGAERLADVPERDGTAVRIDGGSHGSAVVLYRWAERDAATLSGGGVTLDGRFASLRSDAQGRPRALDAYDLRSISAGDLRVELTPPPPAPLVAIEPLPAQPQGEPSDADLLKVRAAPDAFAPVAGGTDGPERVVRIRQQGGPARWLPLAAVKPDQAGTVGLQLTRPGGFTYDAASGSRLETYFPFRAFRGPVSVDEPATLHVRWSDEAAAGDAAAATIRLSATAAGKLRISGAAVETRRAGGGSWTLVDARDADGASVVEWTGRADLELRRRPAR
jgi:hypothetical protein